MYSLILRIRGLLIIKLLGKNKMYNKDALFQYLENRGLKKPVIEELYKKYKANIIIVTGSSRQEYIDSQPWRSALGFSRRAKWLN